MQLLFSGFSTAVQQQEQVRTKIPGRVAGLS